RYRRRRRLGICRRAVLSREDDRARVSLWDQLHHLLDDALERFAASFSIMQPAPGMASTTTHLMTVEDFLNLPEDQAHVCELRNGELVEMTRPAHDHARIQHNIYWLLVEAAGGRRSVFFEAAFRPVPEYNVRVADVAYAPIDRWKSIPKGALLAGAPDLVVE